MKYIFAVLLLSATALLTPRSSVAQQQHLVCNTSTGAYCNTSSNPGNGSQGMPAWLAFGTTEANFDQVYGMLGPTGTLPLPLYGLQFNNNGTLASLLPGATGTWCLSWTVLGAPPTLVSCGSGSGTVTSIGMTVPTWLTVSPSAITTSGIFAISGTIEPNNYVLASAASGSPTGLGPRALVAADIPTISYTGISGLGTFATQNFASPPAIGGTTPAAGSFSVLTDTTITGLTQCVHVNSSGVFSGTGIDCGSGSGGVTSFSGDGALLNNSASTGAVTTTLANTGVGYGVWGNIGAATGAPGYHALASYPLAAFPTFNQSTTGNAATATALAATPAQCSGGTFSTGVTAAGTANCSSVGTSLTALNGTNVTSGTIAGTYVAVANLAASGNGGVTGLLPNANLANASVTLNGQTVALGASGNVNSGASQYSVALNGAAGAAIGGIIPGSTGTYCFNWASLTANPTLITCPGAGGGLTSVGLSTTAAWLTVANSPLTTNGTITLNPTTAQTANEFVATPNGSAGAVSLRTIVAADIPTLNQSTTGNAATATALVATPTQCTGGQFATGVAATGNANCGTPAGSGNVSTSGSPTQYQTPAWASGTTVQGIGPGVAGQAYVSGGASAYPSFSSSLNDVTSVNSTTIPASSTLLISGGALGTPSSGTLTNATGLPFSGLATGTDTTATLTVGTGGILTYSGSGVVNANQTGGIAFGTFATQNYATPPAIGGTTPAAGAFTTLSATGNLTTNVTGSTQCLQASSGGVVSGTGSTCGSGGSTAFSALTGSTNTTAAMVVGTGASLATSGTGTVSATSLTALTGLPTIANNTILANTSGSTAAPAATSAAATLGLLQSITCNAQTGTTYTTVLGDGNGCVTMSNTSPNTVTVPANASVAYAVGTTLTLQEINTGITTISPAAGVTLCSLQYGCSTSQTYALAGNYDFLQIQQTTTNNWLVTEVGPGRINMAGTTNLASTAFGGVSGSLPIGSVSGLGTGVATFLTTPSSANLASAVTGATGSGALVFGTSPTFTTGTTLGFITGSTQCLHVNTSGAVSGTGSDCGSGGSTAFSALTGSTNTTAAMVVGTGASLATSGTGTITASGLNATGLGTANTWTAVQDFTKGDFQLSGTSTGNTTLNSGLAGSSNNTLTLPITATDTLAALGTAETWTAAQTFTNSDIKLLGSSTGVTTFTSNNASATNYTLTIPAVSDTVDVLGTAQTFTAAKTFTNSDLLLLGSSTGATTFTSANVSATAYTATVPANTGTLAELNLAETWSALQTFGTNISIGGVTATGATGTGAVVFGTSPTLATPALGTPSAINLTNAAAGSLPLTAVATIANNTILANGSGSTASASATTAPNVIAILNAPTCNAQTGTTYTGVLGDANGCVTMSNSSANTFTVPPNSGVAYPVGTTLTVEALGTGITTITPGAGVTLQSPQYGASTSISYNLVGAYDFAQFKQISANAWLLTALGPGRGTAPIDVGTKFTLGTGTGTCATSSTLVGGAATGKFTCTGTSGASTQVINLPTAPNGWVCEGNDLTTTTDTVHQTASATNSATLSGTIVANDVVNFMCSGY